MKRILLVLAGLVLASPVMAADNYAATEGSGKTFRCIEAGGICYPVFRVESGGVASGGFASGSIASGAVASGAIASGAVASGAIASGAVASGAYAAGSISDGANVALGAVADSAATQGSTGTVSAKLRTITAQLNTIAGSVAAAIPAGTNTIGTVGQLPYPVGATPITASATGTTGATTATLASVGGKTTYICGYSIRANATAATTVTNTITGVITATLSSVMWVAPAASGIGIDEQIFSPCIPASGTNVDIAIVSGAPGSGGVVSSKGWGYNL